MRIAECSYEDVKHLASAGAREAVSIKPSRNTVWFALYNRYDLVVGSMGLIVNEKAVRLKGWYIRPQYRGTGWGSALRSQFEGYAPERPLELVSRTPELWERRGFVRTRQDSKGSWWLRRAAPHS